MATRWRCPPRAGWGGHGVGLLGNHTQGVEGTRPPFGLGDPGVEEAVGHVVEHALVLGQEELLEHEADPSGPQRGQLPIESCSTSRPVTRTFPELGRSKVPIRCNKVVLPDPEGPTMPTSSPRATEKETPRRAVTGGSLG